MITNILLGLILLVLIGIGYLLYKMRILVNGLFGLIRMGKDEKLDYAITNLHAIWEGLHKTKNQYPIIVPKRDGFERQVVNGDY